METSRLRHKGSRSRGFTLFEIMIAVLVLTVGLVAIAALVSKTANNTSRSRFMSLATMLASEKLEDLNRYPSIDPVVWAPSGGTAGSLTADTGPVSVTSAGVTENVDYYDLVQLSGSSGFVIESITGRDVDGNTTYTVLEHKPDGTINTTTSTTAPTMSGVDAVMFKRRWVIEKDVPVAGVRRITVLVMLQNVGGANAVTFQTSMVRP
jgi:prepilin-type N-terminal cleavage/methylation domain-containing protein